MGDGSREERRETGDGWIQGEIYEGENVFERTAIIEWALRTNNGWMDDGGRETKDEWQG